MQRDVITIPHGLMRPTSLDWDIDWRGQSAGDSTTGISQVIYNAFPRWIGSPQIFLSQAAIPQWRAIRLSLQGRRNVLRVRMCDIAFGRAQTGLTQEELSEGLSFSSGVRFETGKGVFADPFCVATADAAAGATQITVDVSSHGVAPIAGQIMSADDWPFAVTAVTNEGSNVYTLDVTMPLRAAITAGDYVMMNGYGRFELTDERTGLAAYDITRTARPTVSLQEVIAR